MFLRVQLRKLRPITATLKHQMTTSYEHLAAWLAILLGASTGRRPTVPGRTPRWLLGGTGTIAPAPSPSVTLAGVLLVQTLLGCVVRVFLVSLVSLVFLHANAVVLVDRGGRGRLGLDVERQLVCGRLRLRAMRCRCPPLADDDLIISLVK